MPYYNAGDYYGRGDYYQGDYGDPGLFGSIGRIFGKVTQTLGGLAAKVLPGPFGAAVRLALPFAAGGSRTALTSTVSTPEIAAPALPTMFAPTMFAPPGPGGGIITRSPLGTPVSAGAIERQLHPFGMRRTHLNRTTYVIRGGGTSRWGAPQPPQVIAKGTVPVVNRRMNPANPRALRRSLRRVVGFAKLAARARKSVAHAAVAVGVRHRGAKRKK